MVKFEYHDPSSVQEAAALLAEYGDAARLLAGGTALLVDMNNGHIHPRHLVSLTGIPGLEYIRENSDGGWQIGAMTLLSTVEAFAPFQDGPTTVLVEATQVLGSRQIRNMGTVGGNICHASPGADMVPPLLCLDAELRLVGPDGERTTPLDWFLLGPDQTAIKPAEILSEITVPAMPERSGSVFHKVMRRHAMDCSIVAVAARISLDEDGETCVAARIGVGAAAPVPFRASEAETLLEGERLTEELAAEAGRHAEEAASPITDVRASATYRRMLVRGLVTRAVADAWQRAQSGMKE